MVEKDIRVTQSDSVSSKGNDVNLGDSKDVELDNADIDNENDMEEDDETSSSMASKNSKGTSSSKSVDLTEEQLAFCDAFDISLRGQIRR
ncbi:hypothetical protein Tco_1186813 [Tanacetum coccineum]